MAVPRPPPLPPPSLPPSLYNRSSSANQQSQAQNASNLPQIAPNPTNTKTEWVDQDHSFVHHHVQSSPLAYQHVPSSQHQATVNRRQGAQTTQPPPHAPPQSQPQPPQPSNPLNLTPPHSVSLHTTQRVQQLSLTSQPAATPAQTTLHQVAQPQHYEAQGHLYQTQHRMQQQLQHQQLAQRQLQQQRHQFHRHQQQQQMRQQPAQQLALHQQSQNAPLRLQPRTQQQVQVQNPQHPQHPQLQQGLYQHRQHPHVTDLHPAAINPSATIQPGVLQTVPGTDVLSVADAAQIGMSFANPAGPGQLDPYQQLPPGGSREYPNADFWHTVIDHTKQQQVAAAAAAAAAAASSTPLRNAGTPPQLFNVSTSAGQVLPARPLSNQPRPSQIAEPRIQKPMLTCDVCGRTFGQRGSLGRHKKAVHMGVRPFPCETCGFCFQQRYDLRKHILSVHEHERPFACEVKGCKAAFSRRAKLRKHVTTVHLKQRDFICDVCQSAFGEKSNMTKHIRAVHLQERKYQCNICSAAFKERGHCTKHMLTQHNVHSGREATTSVTQAPRT